MGDGYHYCFTFYQALDHIQFSRQPREVGMIVTRCFRDEAPRT